MGPSRPLNSVLRREQSRVSSPGQNNILSRLIDILQTGPGHSPPSRLQSYQILDIEKSVSRTDTRWWLGVNNFCLNEKVDK